MVPAQSLSSEHALPSSKPPLHQPHEQTPCQSLKCGLPCNVAPRNSSGTWLVSVTALKAVSPTTPRRGRQRASVYLGDQKVALTKESRRRYTVP